MTGPRSAIEIARARDASKHCYSSYRCQCISRNTDTFGFQGVASGEDITLSNDSRAASQNPLFNSHLPHHTQYSCRSQEASKRQHMVNTTISTQSLNHDWILLTASVIIITFCLFLPAKAVHCWKHRRCFPGALA